MEVYAHDPQLASRLAVMAHWRLTPTELQKLNEEEIGVMHFAFSLLEKRWNEIFVDVFGVLLGASWPIGYLQQEDKEELKDEGFTWSLREKPERISTPVTAVIGGKNFLDHIKQLSSKKRLSKRKDPSVLNHPGKEWVGRDQQFIDLSDVPKEEFLKVAGRFTST